MMPLKKYQLFIKAITCFGTWEKAADWLKTPHAALEHKTPWALADEGETGYQKVTEALGRIEHGIFA